MEIVYALETFVVGTLRVDAGTVWPADDPIVKHNPGGFTPNPVSSPSFRATVRPVEQATAAPGERRNTRRAQ